MRPRAVLGCSTPASSVAALLGRIRALPPERRLQGVLPKSPASLKVGRGVPTARPTAIELGKVPRETWRLLPLLPPREERVGERRFVPTPMNPLPNPLPVRRGEGEASARFLSVLNSMAVAQPSPARPSRGEGARRLAQVVPARCSPAQRHPSAALAPAPKTG